MKIKINFSNNLPFNKKGFSGIKDISAFVGFYLRYDTYIFTEYKEMKPAFSGIHYFTFALNILFFNLSFLLYKETDNL